MHLEDLLSTSDIRKSHSDLTVSRTVTMNVQVSVFPLGSVAKRFTVFVPIEKKVPELSVAE